VRRAQEGSGVPAIRIKDAAVLLGVSDDTVRRWIDGGSLVSHKDESGRKVIAGEALKFDGSGLVCGGVQTANATVYMVDTVMMPPAK
jgi:excisionase family DNA binding protein